MNKQDIIRMAREVGLERIVYTMPCGASDWLVPDYERLERFAALVAAAEREECARACEAEFVSADETEAPEDYAYNDACEHCAAAIRARGETTSRGQA